MAGESRGMRVQDAFVRFWDGEKELWRSADTDRQKTTQFQQDARLLTQRFKVGR
jgi:hypothetical protein